MIDRIDPMIHFGKSHVVGTRIAPDVVPLSAAAA